MRTSLNVASGIVWIAVLTLVLPLRSSAGVLALDGAWRLALDRHDAGIRERWFERELTGRVRLPGSLPGQGIGDPITPDTAWTGGIVDRSWFTAPGYAEYREAGRVKVPFWLQPETHYVGAAWYQREIEIPQRWEGRVVHLFLERPHWETRVWIDGRSIGSADALGTPHEHVLGSLSPGRHRLTIRVDNRLVIDVGHNSHSVSDHTQGNWNGIVGRLELRATPVAWMDDIQVFPDQARRVALVQVAFRSVAGREVTGRCDVSVHRAGSRAGVTGAASADPLPIPAGGTRLELEVPLSGGWATWDEFSPALHVARVTWRAGDAGEQQREVVFGIRDFRVKGTQFTINGRPVFLRGTLECSIFPRTGHPPVDVASWRKVLKAARAHGLNNLRFHSHCPPEAAFVAADELGMYLHVEASSWANESTTLGDGKPVDRWVMEETDRILRHYGNHPSFVLMAYGNEPGGARHQEWLTGYVSHYQSRDPRRLWTSGAGWPQLPVNQWHSTPDPRIQGWGEGLSSRINARPPETTTDYREYLQARSVPVVSHEIGQWCVYPNFAEMRKYTGYLKPRNFEIFKATLERKGMSRLAPAFLHASGRLQTLCYKEDIESALRTPGMGGFQLLDLHDFPGQGTALVGVLDPFWESKGYVTAAEYARFCGPTVPLVRLPRRIFTTSETLAASVEVAHFGPEALRDTDLRWRLLNERGRVVEEGRLGPVDVEIGNAGPVGSIRVPFAAVDAPARLRLEVRVGKGRSAPANDWDLWVYPTSVDTGLRPGVLAIRELDEAAVAALDRGQSVVWMIPPSRVRPDPVLGKVEIGFSSIFWNTAWTRRQAPHTLGILCDPAHPLFEEFPTDAHSNWQWWYLIRRSGALLLDGLPKDLDPLVRVIDDWFTARPLGLVVEARVGRGRLLAFSVDLDADRPRDLVQRQFLGSLMKYAGSDRFRPRTEATVEQMRSLVVPP